MRQFHLLLFIFTIISCDQLVLEEQNSNDELIDDLINSGADVSLSRDNEGQKTYQGHTVLIETIHGAQVVHSEHHTEVPSRFLMTGICSTAHGGVKIVSLLDNDSLQSDAEIECRAGKFKTTVTFGQLGFHLIEVQQFHDSTLYRNRSVRLKVIEPQMNAPVIEKLANTNPTTVLEPIASADPLTVSGSCADLPFLINEVQIHSTAPYFTPVTFPCHEGQFSGTVSFGRVGYFSVRAKQSSTLSPSSSRFSPYYPIHISQVTSDTEPEPAPTIEFLAIDAFNGNNTANIQGHFTTVSPLTVNGTCLSDPLLKPEVVIYSNSLKQNPAIFACLNGVWQGDLDFSETGWFGIQAHQNPQGDTEPQLSSNYVLQVTGIDGQQDPNIGNDGGNNQTPPVGITPEGERIDLSQVLILNEIGQGDAEHLIDEQTLVGDPRGGNGGTGFQTEHHYNWRVDKNAYPYLNIIVDLRKNYTIKSLFIYGGNNRVSLQIGGPMRGTWADAGEVQLQMDQWNAIGATLPTTSTRYIRIKLLEMGTDNWPRRANFGKEIALYATPTNDSLPEPIPEPQNLIPRPYMEDFIGTNSLIDHPVNGRYIQNNGSFSQNPTHIPQGGLEVFPVIRTYSMHQWFEGDFLQGDGDMAGYPGNQIEFEMSNSWNYDYYTQYLKEETSQVTGLRFQNYATISYTPMHLLQPAILDFIGRPIHSYNWDFGEAKTIEAPNGQTLLFSDNPQHFKSSAKFYFNMAARYGSNSNIPTTLLSLRNNQTPKTGLNHLKVLELLNETDAWWHFFKHSIDVDGDGESDTGLLFYWHPYEYAAYLSAGLDGHEGALGQGHGAKNADPNILISHNGLAFPQMDYPLLVDLWAKNRRDDKKAPFDILNFHHYSNTNGFQGASDQIGVTPEQDQLYKKMSKLVDQRNRFFPNKPIWITEFGYDSQREQTANFSPQGVPDLPGFSRQETQGIWLIRSYLAMAAAGIDQACQYMLRDTISEGAPGEPYAGALYATSGVVGNYPHYTPKAAYYYVGAFVNSVKGTRFDSILDPVDYQNLNQDVAVYKFSGNKNGEKTVFAIWIPGHLGASNTKNNIVIPTGLVGQSVKIVSLNNSDPHGSLSLGQTDSSGNITLGQISESPVFIISEENL